jgi:hypothetical protein
VTTTEIAEALRDWFAAARYAGLKLPTGWFGRPGDNKYLLASATAEGDRLTIVLDDGQTIAIDRPAVVESSRERFAIAGFEHAVRDWTEYGTPVPHHDTYTDGAFEFISI